jgi:hypothetical protein
MREWLLVLSPILVVVYFLVFPGHLNALMTIAMRFVS